MEATNCRADAFPRGILGATVFTLAVLASGCTGSTEKDVGDTGSVSLQPSQPDKAGGSTQHSEPDNQQPEPDNQQPEPDNAPAPTVSLSASAMTVDEGGETTITWSAMDADSCSASGGWSGTLAVSGRLDVGPLTTGTTFSLSCSGPGGSVLEMISIAVVGPVQLSWLAPTQNVDGSQLTDLAGYRIYYGDSSRAYSEMVELGDPSATDHVLTLSSGDYYVAMTAFDIEGNESVYSNEVMKTRL